MQKIRVIKAIAIPALEIIQAPVVIPERRGFADIRHDWLKETRAAIQARCERDRAAFFGSPQAAAV